jgi:CO/xanthine dehydrogenase Mo-binding subunit
MAQVLGLPEQDIIITHAEGAGCYGHNAADDVTLDAVLLARAVPGKPVRVQWMREDEFAWEPFSSPMVVKLNASLDAQGNIVNWGHELWSHAHSTRPGGKGGVNLLAAWHLEKPLPAAKPGNPPLPGGGSHRNAVPLYDFPNQKITNHLIRQSPIRTSALRALGGHANAYAIECFIDELAEAAGADPVEYRLRHLKDARAKAVIEKVAQMAKWKPNEKGDGERGRGIGFARYKNLAAYIAVIAEVHIAEEVRVTKLWGAVDVGQAINPDGVINQIEGGMIQSASWTLKEHVDFDKVGITTRNWLDYPILSFVEVPEIEVALINRPEAPPVGAGEGTQGPVSGAIGNAIYNAIGARLRDMPFTRDRIVAALST